MPSTPCSSLHISPPPEPPQARLTASDQAVPSGSPPVLLSEPGARQSVRPNAVKMRNAPCRFIIRSMAANSSGARQGIGIETANTFIRQRCAVQGARGAPCEISNISPFSRAHRPAPCDPSPLGRLGLGLGRRGQRGRELQAPRLPWPPPSLSPQLLAYAPKQQAELLSGAATPYRAARPSSRGGGTLCATVFRHLAFAAPDRPKAAPTASGYDRGARWSYSLVESGARLLGTWST